MEKTNSHFMPGVLIGFVAGVIVCGAVFIAGPKATYDRALNEIGANLIVNAKQLEGCTAAYVASHEGMIPQGTVLSGEGRQVVVVGFNASVPQK